MKMAQIKKYFLVCKCGKIIPLVRDSAVLGRAIEEHVEEHKRMVGEKENADLDANLIHDYLLQQAFEKAAVFLKKSE